MKDITPILKSLGLLDSEIKTYLSALENGPGTVLDFAKLTELSRQAVYVAIDSLTKRGLMSSALRGKKRFYAAEHPDKLLAYAKRRDAEMREKVQDLERMLPELELQAGGEKPVVKVFEGKGGLRTLIEEMALNPGKKSLEITDVEAMKNVLSPNDINAMRLKLKKFGTHVQGFYTSIKSKKNRYVMLRGKRFQLPAHLKDFKSNIGVYGDKIVFISFAGKIHTIVIDDKNLVNTMAILFHLAFQNQSSS